MELWHGACLYGFARVAVLHVLHMDTRNPLSIRLTEPVVFLRSYDPSGRHPPDPEDPPALIRALLTLNVTRPTRISTIEAELRGVVSLTWPEGVSVLLFCRHPTTWLVSHAHRRRCSPNRGNR